jgi:poly(hydroxyalkanoate) depolymerase family esterase
MRLSKTISRLNKARKAVAAFTPPSASGPSRLSELTGVSENPGNLRGFYYVPEGLKASAPLVVVLHGCTQNAGGYDSGSGWSRLADRHGFALLFPEQQRSNNPNLCFNWYQDSDTQRGMGEAASIHSMVEAMQAAHGLDPQRIFVTGLSAGGAMASVMLAAYPDVFAGGAIIAGLPYGCASNLGEAFECMGGRGRANSAALAASVRAASPIRGHGREFRSGRAASITWWFRAMPTRSCCNGPRCTGWHPNRPGRKPWRVIPAESGREPSAKS